MTFLEKLNRKIQNHSTYYLKQDIKYLTVNVYRSSRIKNLIIFN